jgi:hypothetical protein
VFLSLTGFEIKVLPSPGYPGSTQYKDPDQLVPMSGEQND